MIWRMKFECEASCCFLTGEDIERRRAISPDSNLPSRTPHFAAYFDVNASATQIAAAADTAAGAVKKNTPHKIVNPM